MTATYPSPKFGNIFLDANALDRIDDDRSELVKEFAQHVERLELSVIAPNGVQNEVSSPNTPHQVQRDMPEIYTLDVGRTCDEERTLSELKTILTGNAKSGKHHADAGHLFEAAKYGGTYFITHDNRMLDRRDEIRRLLTQLHIVSLADFLAICRAH